jgi:hypothetical protein
MKNILIILCLSTVFFGCKTETEKSIEESEKLINQIEKLEKASKRTDELMEKSTKEFYTDTTGLANSPIKVYKSKFVEKEYSNYKDIVLYFKNISKKDISAVRFEWYGENAFNEPAEMGSHTLKGIGGGFSDDELRAGKSTSGTWEINSIDGKKIISARAFEVVYKDGTTWKLRN